MATRSSWKGYLRLSLVTVPVEGVNAVSATDAGVQLHQLHAPCLSRIRYQKLCPVHGEVSNDEIVMGFERSKGEYVVVEKSEADQLRKGGDKAITIDAFVSPDQIDLMQFEGRTYYLMPDGEIARKPYAVLAQAIAAENRFGIGRASLWGRERLVLVRSLGQALCLEILHFSSELAERANIPREIHLPAVTKEEMRLAAKLIEASTVEQFDLASYEDVSTNRLKELIASKAAEQPSAATEDENQPAVVNLMDALRRSVASTRGGSSAAAATRKTSSRAKPAKRRKSTNRRHAG